MANYATLQAAIDAGISNMTVLRNHSRNDDSVTTYPTGIDWFKFNGVTVSNIYSSGNSFLGFGVNSEQLKVNRRDCAVWDEYKETGVIAATKFFKFTWKGTSYYSSSFEHTDSFQQYFEVFLFDTGQIFLRFFKVPTSYFDGANQLICGSQNLGYSVSSGTPVEYTFTPSNAMAGTGWSVSTERPPIDVLFKPSGNVVFTLQNYTPEGGECLYWESDIPEGTSLKMLTKVNDGTYSEILASGGSIPGLPSSSCTLYIKVELSTTNTMVTPWLNSLRLVSNADKKIIVLNIGAPNLRPAVGDVTLSYDGLGGLQGQGGPSEAFDGEFTPDADWYANPNDEEHIEVLVSATSELSLIEYFNGFSEEHIEVLVSASSILTNIHDL